MEKQIFVVGGIADFGPGTCRVLDVGGRSIGVFNIDGELHAVQNLCPHQLAEICRYGTLTGTYLPSAPGELEYGMEGRVLRCYRHHWEFDIETGRTIYDPNDLRVKVYPVSVEDGRIVIEA